MKGANRKKSFLALASCCFLPFAWTAAAATQLEPLLTPPQDPAQGGGRQQGLFSCISAPRIIGLPARHCSPMGPLRKADYLMGQRPVGKERERSQMDARLNRDSAPPHPQWQRLNWVRGEEPESKQELKFPLQATSVLRLPRKMGLATLCPSWPAFCRPTGATPLSAKAAGESSPLCFRGTNRKVHSTAAGGRVHLFVGIGQTKPDRNEDQKPSKIKDNK